MCDHKVRDASILDTIKKMLGDDLMDTAFDVDIIVQINSALFILRQVGLNIPDGFIVTGTEQTWKDLLGTNYNLEIIKSYIYLKTKLVFDPPASATVFNAYEKTIAEYEWRIEHETDALKNNIGGDT